MLARARLQESRATAAAAAGGGGGGGDGGASGGHELSAPRLLRGVDPLHKYLGRAFRHALDIGMCLCITFSSHIYILSSNRPI